MKTYIKFPKNTIFSILAILSSLIIFISIYFLVAQIRFDIWLSDINKVSYTPNIDSFSPIMIILLFSMLLFLQMQHLMKESIVIMFSTLIIAGTIYGLNILPENKGFLYSRYYYLIKDINRDAEETVLTSPAYQELIAGNSKLDPYILYKYQFVEKTKLIKKSHL